MKSSALSRLKRFNFCRTAVIIAAAVFAVSCQSMPERAEIRSSAELLPDSSDIIIRASVAANSEVIAPVLSVMAGNMPEEMSVEFVERTETVFAGLDFDSEAAAAGLGSSFKSSVAAEGDYPKGLVDFSLWWDSGWKKKKYRSEENTSVSITYWDEKDGENQISIPSEQYLLASGGNINQMLDAWVNPAEAVINREWTESEQQADLSIMIRNLSPEDYALFVPGFERLPLESMLLSLKRIDDSYFISGRFHMENSVSAFIFTTLFRTMVVSAKDQNGERLFPDLKEIKILKENNDVVLNGMKLKVTEVVAIESKWLAAAGLNTEE